MGRTGDASCASSSASRSPALGAAAAARTQATFSSSAPPSAAHAAPKPPVSAFSGISPAGSSSPPGLVACQEAATPMLGVAESEAHAANKKL